MLTQLVYILGRKWKADRILNFVFMRIAFCRGVIRARVRGRENHMKPFVRTSFLGTRPSCLPSPGRPFFAADDRKPILWLGRTGSPVNSRWRPPFLLFLLCFLAIITPSSSCSFYSWNEWSVRHFYFHNQNNSASFPLCLNL